MVQLQRIPADLTVWTVYGLDAPAELGGKEHLIGELVTKSNSRTSLYGDEMMFFRHQLASEDFALRPEWKPYYAVFSKEINGVQNNFMDDECPELYVETVYPNGEIVNTPYQSACPFAFLQW